MTFIPEVTQFELEEFGFSNYLIRQITRSLPFRWQRGHKVYLATEIESAIAQKLARPRTTPKTRTMLENFRLRLRGESNVIEINFARGLSDEEELRHLYQERDRLQARRKEVLREVDQVLVEASRLLKKTKKA